jgi:hypothetical protein
MAGAAHSMPALHVDKRKLEGWTFGHGGAGPGWQANLLDGGAPKPNRAARDQQEMKTAVGNQPLC